LIFTLDEQEHPVFTRAGADLKATLNITLMEALTGFSRVILKHLDGRGIHLTLPKGKVMRPDQVIKVKGEGMPHKRSDEKGDLFLEVEIEFPDDGWLKEPSKLDALRDLLPTPDSDAAADLAADTVDEHDFEEAEIDEVSSFSLVPCGVISNALVVWPE
jgi:DnaJ homolog subfamily A member 2